MPDLKRNRKNEIQVEITNEKNNKLTHRSNDLIVYSSVNDTDCNSDNEINSENSDISNEKNKINGKRRKFNSNPSKKLKQTDVNRISYLNKLFSILKHSNNKSYKKLSNHFNKIKWTNNQNDFIKSIKFNKLNSKKEHNKAIKTNKCLSDQRDIMKNLLIN
jgi:hypothetical protein